MSPFNYSNIVAVVTIEAGLNLDWSASSLRRKLVGPILYPLGPVHFLINLIIIGYC